MRRNGRFNGDFFKCYKCNFDAIPVNGMYFWCPKCGWMPKVKSNGNHAVF